MRILLDECVPEQVRHAFPLHSVSTVKEMGWRGLKNGALLQKLQASNFDVFIIADKNMRFQQNLDQTRFAILELWTNHRPTLEAHLEYIEAASRDLKPGQYLKLPPP